MSRTVYETHTMEDPRLPIIFHTDTVINTPDRISNWHENIEILCFISGKGRIRIDSEWKPVGAGDIAVINPEMLHAVTSDERIIYHCLIVDNGFCTDNGIDVSKNEFCDIITDGKLYSLLCSLAEKLGALREGTADQYAIPEARHGVLGVLIELCRRYVKRELQGDHASQSPAMQTVRNIITYLREQSGAVSLDHIAEHVGMSKYHMSREFKRITGTTIFEYLNISRCKKARKMLYAGAKVSEAAIASGFDNLSYFSRTFKRYMGLLPSECISHTDS